MSQIALPGGRVPVLRATRDGAELPLINFFIYYVFFFLCRRLAVRTQARRTTTTPPSSCLWFGFKSFDRGKNICVYVNPRQRNSLWCGVMSASWETLMFSFVWTCTEASPTHFVPELKVEAARPASRQHVYQGFNYQARKEDSTTPSSSAIRYCRLSRHQKWISVTSVGVFCTSKNSIGSGGCCLFVGVRGCCVCWVDTGLGTSMASLSTTRSTWLTKAWSAWGSRLTAAAKVVRAAVHSDKGISPRTAEMMEATASADGSTCRNSGSGKKRKRN